MKTHLEPFLATFSGGRAYPFGMEPSSIHIVDIAHALSNICRYAGHVSEFWSVAAHSLEVSRRVEDEAKASEQLGQESVRLLALTALLHDASEAFLLDVPKPIKPLFLNYDAWEENAERAVATRFSLFFPHPEMIHVHDHAMVEVEIANFFAPGSAAWQRYGIKDQHTYARLLPLEPKLAERRFLARFIQLTEWSEGYVEEHNLATARMRQLGRYE